MHVISAVLFAISANMDNIPLGIAYGIRGISISFARNLLIALITSSGTFISMSLGTIVALFLKKETAALIGCSILIIMGLWFIAGFFRKRKKSTRPGKSEASDQGGSDSAEPREEASRQTAGKEPQGGHGNLISITTRQSLALAFVLMINNMGFGIGANIAGLPVLLTSLCTFLCSMLLLTTGVKIGQKFKSNRLSSYSELISGILIVILGIYEFFV
ncbi:manganese efflux pump [Anaerovorax odorimutans]|uniref:Manganese efflux pump n=1 Tax=Anaerovorax odorimutans TaxID=109327 RepID=A0ABT1RSV2_9FIRM|nr:manganese efflux pump [Anaerovorax odorimutans]MCQ4638252.1 manganese efflux pump [Anaerovorax odorimutans]